MASKRSSRASSARCSRASSVEVPARTQQLRQCKVNFIYNTNQMKAAKFAKAAENRLKKAKQLKKRERRRKLGFIHWTQLGPYEIWVREQIMAAVARGGIALALAKLQQESKVNPVNNAVVADTTSSQQSSAVQNDSDQGPLNYNKELKQLDDNQMASLDIEINYMGSPLREPIPDFPEADQILQEKPEVPEPEPKPIADSVTENIDPAIAYDDTGIKHREPDSKKRSW